MPSINYAAVAPVLIVVGAACFSVLLEAFLPRALRWATQVALTLLTLAGAAVALASYIRNAPAAGTTTFSGTLSIDQPALFLWGTLLALGLGSVLLIADRSVEPGGAFLPSSDAAVDEAPRRSGPGATLLSARQDAPASQQVDNPRSGRSRLAMQTEVFPLTLFALSGMM
ncbi:MAG: NADH-quinone oxidoreductase subunit NuoN, partial [Sciscionella sp.]